MAEQHYAMIAKHSEIMLYNGLTVAFLEPGNRHARNARFIATVQREEKRSEKLCGFRDLRCCINILY
jgi:hypothetical protein